MLRVAVVGNACAGKTTLSRQLAARWRIPHVELDVIYWQANWTPLPMDEFRATVALAAAGEEWIIDGDYSDVQDIVWQRATDVVWMNPPLATILWRVMRRSGRRVLTGEELWAGNRETIRDALFGRDSTVWWTIRTHPPRRRRLSRLLRDGGPHQFAVHEIRRLAEVKPVLDRLAVRAGQSPAPN